MWVYLGSGRVGTGGRDDAGGRGRGAGETLLARPVCIATACISARAALAAHCMCIFSSLDGVIILSMNGTGIEIEREEAAKPAHSPNRHNHDVTSHTACLR